MKVAVFGDMHGNSIGLEAVLHELELEPVDRIVCLGDTMQGWVQPRQVMERLQDINCPVVLGNSDSWLLSGESSENVSDDQRAVREWTREQIGRDGLDLISTFHLTYELELEAGTKMLCFHGSPRSFDEVLLPEVPASQIADFLEGHDHSLFAGGHVHLQWTRTLGPRTFFNPGSAGASYNRFMEIEKFHFYAVSEYAVVHAEDSGCAIEFRRLLLDADALAEAALKSDHPFAEKESKRYLPRP